MCFDEQDRSEYAKLYIIARAAGIQNIMQLGLGAVGSLRRSLAVRGQSWTVLGSCSGLGGVLEGSWAVLVPSWISTSFVDNHEDLAGDVFLCSVLAYATFLFC